MGDPLSIAASVVTLVATTKPIMERLEAFKEAPQGLKELLTEVNHLDSLLQAVESAPWSSENSDQTIKSMLGNAKKLLHEIDALVQYTLTEAGTDDKVDRWQWARRRKDVERLMKTLRNICANMVAVLGVKTW